MTSEIPSITSVVEIGDIKNGKYEWNVLIPPYSKLVRDYESTGSKICLKNITFNDGELASHNHSIDLILDVGAEYCHARLTFLLDTNVTFKQCEALTLRGNKEEKITLFNFHKGDFRKYPDIPDYKKKGQYIWWDAVQIGFLADYIDTLRFVFNLEFHYQNEIDVECLENLIESDLLELIPTIHLRIKFRSRYAKYKRMKLETSVQATGPTPAIAIPSCTKNYDLKKFNLLQLLQSTDCGKSIIEVYKNKTIFDDITRRKLLRTIAEFFVEEGVSLGTKDCSEVAGKIVDIFPNEKRESYFIPASKNSNAKGALYTKYNNVLKFYRAKGLVAKSAKATKLSNPEILESESAPSVEAPPSVKDPLPEPSENDDKVFLSKYNKPWDVVNDKWSRTFQRRRDDLFSTKSLKIFMEDWPLLSNSSYGPLLINVDFDLLPVTKANVDVFTNWGSFFRKLTKICKLKFKAKDQKELLALLGHENEGNIIANVKDVPNTNAIELEADRFFLSKDLSDIIFICENEEFNAHRFALASKSSVLEKMFLTNMKEKIENRVEIEGINKEVFKRFLHFFYSGKIEENNVDYLIPLLAAADRYDVPQLKGLCVKLLLRHLNPENALEIYSAGETHNAPALTLEASDVIKKNKHASIPDETAFQYYINKHPSLMFELFKM